MSKCAPFLQLFFDYYLYYYSLIHIVFEGDAAEKDKYVLFVYIIAGELHLHIRRIIIQIVLKLIHPFSFSRMG